MKIKLYLDDVRTPIEQGWTIARNYDEFVKTIEKVGLSNITYISLDHDLGDSAMTEYYTNVKNNGTLDYANIDEKTGMDCCKFLVNHSIDNNILLPLIMVHSANPIGGENMINFINGYYKFCGLSQTCAKKEIPHTIHQSHMIPAFERKKKWDKFFKLTKPKNEKNKTDKKTDS